MSTNCLSVLRIIATAAEQCATARGAGEDTPRDLGADEIWRASQKPFRGNPYHAARRSPLRLIPYMGHRCVRFKARAAIPIRVQEKRLSIQRESSHDSVMSDHTPLHSIENIFYSAASFLAVA